MKLKNKTLLLISILSIFALISCDKKEDDNPVTPSDPYYYSKKYITEVMTDVYYWYGQMPSSVSSTNKDIFEHFDMLLYNQDKWSWMMDGKSYIESETGVYTSWGGVIRQPIDYYDDYSLMLSVVYPSSPFADLGIKRGWTLTHIAGVPVMQLVAAGTFNTEYSKSPNSFTFKDPEGNSHDFNNATARTINTRSSLGYTIFTEEDFEGLTSSVGYFNYLTFNRNMQSDIEEAMIYFKEQDVKELIIDLRYNGGGDVGTMEFLANYIAPQSADNGILAKRKHNNKLSSLDDESKSVIKRTDNSLDLERIFFITGAGTASASEILINGLSPFIEVITVGRTTYGKFNGMYVWLYPEKATTPEYVFLPVSFFTVNRDGKGEYVVGMSPNNDRPDDLYHDFGVEEDNLKACLTYIATGAFPAVPTKTKTKAVSGQKIRTDIDNPGYGLFTDHRKIR